VVNNPKSTPPATKQRHFTINSHDSCGRTIWIADAHRGDRKRFVVRADEKLTAFLELERAIGINIPGLSEITGIKRQEAY